MICFVPPETRTNNIDKKGDIAGGGEFIIDPVFEKHSFPLCLVLYFARNKSQMSLGRRAFLFYYKNYYMEYLLFTPFEKTYSNEMSNAAEIKLTTTVAPIRLPLKATNAPPQNAPIFRPSFIHSFT